MPEASKGQLNTLEIMKILDVLPHRYPFLLVDKIIEVDGDNSCIGIKNVTFNEPQFQGHFPAQPVFPGVLLIEGMAQTAGAMCAAFKGAGPQRPRQVFFTTIDKCKFRKPVTPGDVVRYHMTKIANRRNMWWFRGEAKVDDVLVAEAEVGALLVTG